MKDNQQTNATTSQICDTTTEKMEGNNRDFLILNHDDHNIHHQTLSLPVDEESPLVSLANSNVDNNNNTNNNTEFYCSYSWMRITTRVKWLIFVGSAILAILAFVVVRRYGPIFMKEEVTPMIHWLNRSFSPSVLGVILFAAIAILPIILLPTLPFKWIAGMTFGYGISILLITTAEAVAISVPFLISNRFFLHRIKDWLDNHPREAAIIRLAGDGDWLHQFQAVALIRLAPFPYVIFNYVAVATGVKYTPYLVGTMLGVMPEVFVSIYSGILIRKVSEAMEDHTSFSERQVLLDGVGLCITVAATIIIAFYSNKRLKQLQEEDS